MGETASSMRGVRVLTASPVGSEALAIPLVALPLGQSNRCKNGREDSGRAIERGNQYRPSVRELLRRDRIRPTDSVVNAKVASESADSHIIVGAKEPHRREGVQHIFRMEGPLPIARDQEG